VFQDIEPWVFDCVFEGGAFVRVVFEELVYEVDGFGGQQAFVAEFVLALHGVLEDVCDGVVVEGQGAGQPGWMEAYMK
jgi:hypothetical protein